MIKKIINKLISLIKTSKTTPLKTINVEYLRWLSFANAGMLNRGNIYCIDYAIRNLPSNNPIVEIGSFCGLSTNTISYLLKKHNRQNRIFTSDKWIFEGAENGGNLADTDISHSEFKSFVIEAFKRNVGFFSRSNLPFAIEVFSDEFFELWSSGKMAKDVFNRDIQMGGGISFAYIDGNHTYEFSKRDFLNTSKFLDKGGFILFDDSSDNSKFGCAKLMSEILSNRDYELVLKNPNYLFRKIN